LLGKIRCNVEIDATWSTAGLRAIASTRHIALGCIHRHGAVAEHNTTVTFILFSSVSRHFAGGFYTYSVFHTGQVVSLVLASLETSLDSQVSAYD
jgi:hypothetical protein